MLPVVPSVCRRAILRAILTCRSPTSHRGRPVLRTQDAPYPRLPQHRAPYLHSRPLRYARRRFGHDEADCRLVMACSLRLLLPLLSMSRGLLHGRTRPAPPVSAEQDQPGLTHRHGGRRGHGAAAHRRRGRRRGRRGHLEQGRRLRVHATTGTSTPATATTAGSSSASPPGRRSAARPTRRARTWPPRTSRSPSPRRSSRGRAPAPGRPARYAPASPAAATPRHRPLGHAPNASPSAPSVTYSRRPRPSPGRAPPRCTPSSAATPSPGSPTPVRSGAAGGSLYDANRKAIGADPDLIVPGQRLEPAARRPHATEPAHRRRRRASPTGSQVRTPEARREKDSQTSEKQGPASRRARSPPRSSAALGTPYRAAGSSWSKGYHTGVDFPVPTGTSVKSVAAGQVVDRGLGRLLRLPGGDPARRRPLHASTPICRRSP